MPPESPHFVDVPKPFQADLRKRRMQKGFTPDTREIFPRNRPEKRSEDFLTAVTQEPQKRVNFNDPSIPAPTLYKARMAALRREHLREGLTSLLARKRQQQRHTQLRSQMKQAESQRLVAQGPRTDEFLTANTVPAAMLPSAAQQSHLSAAAEAAALHAQKVDNTARHAERQAAFKTDALHSLYMNSRNFITDEAQLLAAVRKEFDLKTFQGELGGAGTNNKSMWSYGPPDDIKAMIDGQWTPTAAGERTRLANYSDQAAKRLQERVKRVAEKLSGGKI